MLNTLVFDMPVEQGLEFMSPISSDSMNSKRKFLDDMIDESNGIFLRMTGVYFQCPNPCGVVNGGILIALYLLAVIINKAKKLNVYLYVVARYLLFIALRMYGSSTDFSRETIQPMTLENAIDCGVTNTDVMITLQIPHDSDRAQVINTP